LDSDAQVHTGGGLNVAGSSGGGAGGASLEVEGGTYSRTYTSQADGGVTGEADPAHVSDFRLDEYLVTVGRFRPFVDAWNEGDGGMGYAPPAGSGKHTYLNGGLGLANSGDPGTYETGWVASDDAHIAPTGANLDCDSNFATWTPSAGGNENLPINCVNWFESYAFCIWDGGFLPSESEWEYAAAGGSQEREYPWGRHNPGEDNQYAIYGGDGDCDYPSGVTGVPCTGVANLAPVGVTTLGVGRWGQFDMAGEVNEWNLDGSAPYVAPCSDCAYLTSAANRVLRGGFFDVTSGGLLASYRYDDPPSVRSSNYGFRCARAP
jgi:formylglycine-generating enzyme required for sulfatase activity